MKVNRFWILLILGLLNSCANSEGDWKTIELGRYQLDVPQNFKFKLQNGIDSQGGEITDVRSGSILILDTTVIPYSKRLKSI